MPTLQASRRKILYDNASALYRHYLEREDGISDDLDYDNSCAGSPGACGQA